MENYIFYCYKKWLKETEDSILKQISKLPVGATILLSFLILSLIAIIVFVIMSEFDQKWINWAYVSIGFESVVIIITSIYSEKNQITYSKKNFENYKNRCSKLEEFLSQYGITNNFIPTLIERYNAKISEIEELIKRRHEVVNKFMEMLLIPISALILGAMLDKDTSIPETLLLGGRGLIIISLVYGIIVFMLFLYDAIMRIPENKYKQFVADLQSFLDIEKCSEACEEVLSEDNVS